MKPRLSEDRDWLIPSSRGFQVLCPLCGEVGVEQGHSDRDDQEQDAVTVHPDRDEYESPIFTRGGYTEIRLWCSAGHRFALIIANHKGAQFLDAVYPWDDASRD